MTKPRGAVVADSTSNSLVITDVATRINEVEQFVRGLDRRTPQVSIQAKIIFVDRTSVEEFGVKYDLGTPTQFYNRLIQRPDPANPGETFNANETVVDLGGNQLAAVGNAEARILNPALDLLFSTAEITAHLVDALPDPEVVILPGIGHMPNLEAPERFDGAVRTFATSFR